MQDENRPLTGVQVPEGTLELVAIHDAAGLVANRRRRERRQLHLHGPASSLSKGVKTCVDEQPVQPRLEAVWVTQAREVAPRTQVRVLDCVARQLVVAQDQPGDGLESGDRRVHQCGERVVITPSRSLDKIPLVHGHPRPGPSAAF